MLRIPPLGIHSSSHSQGIPFGTVQCGARRDDPEECCIACTRDKPRKSRKVKPWTVEEAQQFLASAREADDSLYAAFVLILVLGLRRGEVLGLAWELVDLDQAELFVGEQLQRVNHKILRRETKTEASEAPLPLPAICVAR